MNGIRFFLFFSLVLVTGACKQNNKKPNIRNISVETNIHRFEKELFNMDTDTIPEAIEYFYKRYGDFFDIFSYYIVDLGRPSDKAFSGYLRLFVNDELNREVFHTVNKIYPDIEYLEEDFNRAFRYFKYYLPDKNVPSLITFISRFNYPYFTVSEYIGIGLDMYLGPDSEYYERLGLPWYQIRNMRPERIVPDIMSAYASAIFPFQDSSQNVLSQIIYEGKIFYFLEKVLPGMPDTTIFGFSKDQLRWCRNNEEEMWTYLVENDLIFSTDAMDIRKLVSPAPFTSFFGSGSPGRAAVWIGYKIVQAYAGRNRDLLLKDIMNENNYRRILESARYNP